MADDRGNNSSTRFNPFLVFGFAVTLLILDSIEAATLHPPETPTRRTRRCGHIKYGDSRCKNAVLNDQHNEPGCRARASVVWSEFTHTRFRLALQAWSVGEHVAPQQPKLISGRYACVSRISLAALKFGGSTNRGCDTRMVAETSSSGGKFLTCSVANAHVAWLFHEFVVNSMDFIQHGATTLPDTRGSVGTCPPNSRTAERMCL
jgi:hypothetical protein